MRDCAACGEPVGGSGAKGFCYKHYWRWKTYGDPLATKRLSLEARHTEGTDRRGPDECWPWKGLRDKDGYGLLSHNNRQVRAHRVAYELATGTSADGLTIRHAVCDNPPCQNPAHLLPGTVADNNHDKASHGRARGNQTGNLGDLRRRLTAGDVEEIRAFGNPRRGSRADLARRFGISQEHARRIQNGTRR